MSQILKKIPIVIISQKTCEDILGRPLSINQRCGQGVFDGETVSQVINIDDICLKHVSF